MEDKRIIQLLWDRAEEAIDALAGRFGKLLYQIARNILSSHWDAEECVSDTYLAVWNAIPPTRPDSLTGFVCRVGRNTALNHLRSQTARKRCGDYELSLQELEATLAAPGFWETVDARALGRAIDAFLDTLPADSRILFLRRYWFGDSVKEIAALLSMKENAVSVRLSRIRDKLKTHLTKEGFYCE